MKRQPEIVTTNQAATSIVRLTEADLERAAELLAARDPALRKILTAHGPPPMWERKPGFPTLIHIILEQQVSLASAAAIYRRLQESIVPFRPERFVEIGPVGLKALGLTRQKTEYCLHLAQSVVDKRISLTRIARLEDELAKTSLLQLKGIGSWSADIYLLMALRRADVWPSGDLALALTIKRLRKLDYTPSHDEMMERAERWRPFRSVAARMLWQSYLAERRSKTT
jgi:DNA-3-methyladenine glycosylase II